MIHYPVRGRPNQLLPMALKTGSHIYTVTTQEMASPLSTCMVPPEPPKAYMAAQAGMGVGEDVTAATNHKLLVSLGTRVHRSNQHKMATNDPWHCRSEWW
jgi:hypothetical protein